MFIWKQTIPIYNKNSLTVQNRNLLKHSNGVPTPNHHNYQDTKTFGARQVDILVSFISPNPVVFNERYIEKNGQLNLRGGGGLKQGVLF